MYELQSSAKITLTAHRTVEPLLLAVFESKSKIFDCTLITKREETSKPHNVQNYHNFNGKRLAIAKKRLNRLRVSSLTLYPEKL